MLVTLRNFSGQSCAHTALMNKIYRFQRYIYDATRIFILFGRDRVIKEIKIKPDDRILEIGCGTARNLIKLSKRCPKAKFFGIDASTEMLKTARKKIERKGLTKQVTTAYSLAENFDHGLFDPNKRFDAIFFSYSLSMMLCWKSALNNALKNLNNGKKIYIVDFWDQHSFPNWFQFVVQKWLKIFHVRFNAELMKFLKNLELKRLGELQIIPVLKSYSYIAIFTKAKN